MSKGDVAWRRNANRLRASWCRSLMYTCVKTAEWDTGRLVNSSNSPISWLEALLRRFQPRHARCGHFL